MVQTHILPEKYGMLKQDIAKELDRIAVTKSWGEILDDLKKFTSECVETGPDIIPQIDFTDIKTLSEETKNLIKKRGAVVIRNIVPEEKAKVWKKSLEEYVKVNDVNGLAIDKNSDNKEFFESYWTKAQVEARAHPNVLASSTWLNNLYHQPIESGSEKIDGLNLDQPLVYADRYRIRRPGSKWEFTGLKPHVDGGGIERWEDTEFRKCFKDILNGKWKQHDPYDLGPRLNARSSLYGKANAASIFRAFQGWLSLSSTGPGEGTLQVFPNVILANSYLILRPFFRMKEGVTDVFDHNSWEFDQSSPVFPGVFRDSEDGFFFKMILSDEFQPHLRLKETMVSIPRVNPGDMVFWHCDVVHAVEADHKGNDDSCVLYIPAVPTTTPNKAYVLRQKERFIKGLPPSDFPQNVNPEFGNKGVATEIDIVGDIARRAMGLIEV